MPTNISPEYIRKFHLNIFEHTNGCHIWRGGTLSNGCGNRYAAFVIDKEVYLSHRLSYYLSTGKDPGNNQVNHCCPSGDNPLCVNPKHLTLGSHALNALDFYERAGLSRRGPKLSAEDVLDIRQFHKEGMLVKTNARLHKVAMSMIRRIVTYKRWAFIKEKD